MINILIRIQLNISFIYIKFCVSLKRKNLEFFLFQRFNSVYRCTFPSGQFVYELKEHIYFLQLFPGFCIALRGFCRVFVHFPGLSPFYPRSDWKSTRKFKCCDNIILNSQTCSVVLDRAFQGIQNYNHQITAQFIHDNRGLTISKIIVSDILFLLFVIFFLGLQNTHSLLGTTKWLSWEC